jgi:hypothetical protein
MIRTLFLVVLMMAGTQIQAPPATPKYHAPPCKASEMALNGDNGERICMTSIPRKPAEDARIAPPVVAVPNPQTAPLVDSPLPDTQGPWVLAYRSGRIQKFRAFAHRSAAIDWIERDKPAYEAVWLWYGGRLYPCRTAYEMESSGVPGRLVRSKLVSCYSKAEEEEFQRRTPPSPSGGWSVN